MAKSRRKAGGCTRGRFRLKRLGKGWSTHRRLPVRGPGPATLDDLAAIEAASPPIADKPPSRATKIAVKKKARKKDGSAVIQPATSPGAKKASATKGTAKKGTAKQGNGTKGSAEGMAKKTTAKKAPGKKGTAKKSDAKSSDQAKSPDAAKGQDSSST